MYHLLRIRSSFFQSFNLLIRILQTLFEASIFCVQIPNFLHLDRAQPRQPLPSNRQGNHGKRQEKARENDRNPNHGYHRSTGEQGVDEVRLVRDWRGRENSISNRQADEEDQHGEGGPVPESLLFLPQHL